jgi:hypothetical protein
MSLLLKKEGQLTLGGECAQGVWHAFENAISFMP